MCKRLSIAGLLCSLALASLGCPGGGDGGKDAAAPPPWARLTLREGQVEVREAADRPWRPAVNGMALAAEAALRTGPESRARVELRDGRKLSLQAGSQLDLGGEDALRLAQGEVLVDSAEQGGGFRVSFGEAREVVRLHPGQVRLRRVEGGDLVVQAEKGSGPGFKLSFGDDSGVVVSRDGSARLSAGGDGPQLRMLMGEATLVRGGQTTALGEGASFKLRMGEGEVVRREALATRARGGSGLRLRLPGEADYRLMAKAGPALEPGTALRSAGPFSLDDGAGGKVELAPGSAVVFGGAYREGGLRAGSLKLESGQARVRLERGSSADAVQIVDAGVAQVTARARGGRADVNVVVKSDGALIEVRAGQAEVRAGTETVELGSGESLSVDAQGRAGKPAREPMPRIVALEGLHTRVFYDRWIPKVAFALGRAEDGAQATLEVGPRPDLSRPWSREQVSGGYLAQRARAGRSYFRVLRDAGGQAGPEAGPVGSLELSPDPVAKGGGGNVTNVVPDTGVQTRVLFQGKVPALNFQWEAVAGAAAYRVRVYTEEDLENPQIDERTAEPRLVLAPGRLREGTYFWYQAALDAGGKQLKASQMNRLALAFDNAATLMRIDAPRPGDRPEGGRIEVRGRAPVGAAVSVNGVEIVVSDDGRFEQVLSNVPAGSLLLFQLKRPGQGPVYYTRHLGR